MTSVLRVELFFDEEAGNWHYRVPALHINGGGTATREDAERDALSAIPHPRCERGTSSLRNKLRRRIPHLAPATSCRNRTQSTHCGIMPVIKDHSPFGLGIMPDHACDRGAARLDHRHIRS